MAGKKQYGLILPNKKSAGFKNLGIRTLNPLHDSDDDLENDECPINWIEESLKKSAGNSGQKSLQKRLIKEALEEDTSVFQYDEMYDNMKAAQNEKKEMEKQNKKPKYIQKILKHTEKRKLESERRVEKKVQKEREAEGDEFKDKESFVTPSYMKKLEELKVAERREEVEKILEERDDVTKHKNMSRFYNHLFKQKMGESLPMETEQSECPSELKKSQNEKSKITESTSESLADKDKILEPEEKDDVQFQRHAKSHKNRDYRRRRTDNSDEDMESNGEELEINKIKDNRSKTSTKELSIDKSFRVTKERDPIFSENPQEESKRSHDLDFKNNRHSKRRHNSSSSDDSSRNSNASAQSARNIKDRKTDDSKVNKTNILSKDVNDKSTKDKNVEITDKNMPEKDKNREKPSINSVLGETDVNKLSKKERLERFMELFKKQTVDEKFYEAQRKYFMRKAEKDAKL